MSGVIGTTSGASVLGGFMVSSATLALASLLEILILNCYARWLAVPSALGATFAADRARDSMVNAAYAAARAAANLVRIMRSMLFTRGAVHGFTRSIERHCLAARLVTTQLVCAVLERVGRETESRSVLVTHLPSASS